MLMTGNQKVCAVMEAPNCLDSDYDDTNSYQVGKMILEETKK